MKVFSLFSGVGGFELGMPKEWKIIGFSEIDKYASQVLKYHYPNIKNYGDCTKIDYGQVPNFDLLTGGSPCQDFSIAGKRAGIMGKRSGLIWEYIRCLKEKKPRYFIWENVKGLLSSRKGFDFASILVAFSENGYNLWWQVLNAKDFGVPQNRERVFVFGTRNGSPKEIFFESKDSGQINIVGTTIGEENTRIGERDCIYGDDGIMGGLKAVDYKQPPQILHRFDSYNKTYSNPNIASTLKAGGDDPNIIVMNKGESQHYRLYDTKGLAPTLQSQSGMSSQKHPFIIADNNKTFCVRKLMPSETEALMSWPPKWTKYGINEKGEKVEISDSQRYKMCGNGVVSNIIKEIIKVLLCK